jgi:diacylglycerol kinase family enzyme
VASCLINTKIKLGIIPFGSGNGLASNLNIPKSLEKAAEIIRKGNSQLIDVGKVNDHYFFSNMGVGIDALIIKKYEKYNKRTLISYVRASITSSIQFKPMQTILSFNNQIINTNAFMLFISNSNEMGYGMSLTPKASLNDGLLDLVVVSKLTFFDKLILGMRVILNKIEKFKKAQYTLIEKMSIEISEKIFLDTQFDGEYYKLKTNKIQVTIIKSGLEVLIN